MDSSNSEFKLHPKAQDLLFQYYRTLSRIFNDVLGHLEIDYISITLLNDQNELLFLSSRPSIECNLIEHHLWSFDRSLHADFFQKNTAQLWETLYPEKWRTQLRHYKQEIPGYSMGVSIPSSFEEYRVVYSFALKSNNAIIKNNIMHKIEILLRMGRFCLQNIIKKIPLPDRTTENTSILTGKKPSLTLITNQQVHYEKST
ncbi:MAG: flagellar biosynthesis protein FlgJ [Legionellaceae bacterium]|nr:flagellar biosynthesis protein FlgJ [Legionellaceae bacterium]